MNKELTDETMLVVEGLASISKSVKESSVSVTRPEARFLVDTYYQVQAGRIAADGQIRSIVKGVDGEGNEAPLALQWVSKNMRNQEVQIKKMLDYYTDNDPVGRWCKDTIGIGPVLAAGCLAYFDINKCNHYNQFWSFCGLNDFNNPWLGKEKAKAITNEIYAELDKENEDILDLFKEIKNSSLVKQVAKYLKQFTDTDGYESKLILSISYDVFESEDDPRCPDKVREFLKNLYADTNENMDRFIDILIRSFIDEKAVTERIIQKVCSRTGRNRRVVDNGLSNVIESKKKKPKYINYTKEDMISYLSKPPYNSQAKQLVYLLGESFVKVSGKPNSLYGRLYKERKALEITRNDSGEYADQAAFYLNDKKWGKDTESYKAYTEGKLPDVQIHRRAKRHAVKMFISHLFEAMYMNKYHRPMKDDIYPIAHLNHSDYIGPEVPFENHITVN